MTVHDPFDLRRFVEAQRDIYDATLAEIRRGRKESHWMWFVFPQLAGLGSSPTSRRYAIRSEAEAIAYLEHPVLGVRLRECTAAMNALPTGSATRVLGEVDAMKFRSSMTLFSHVAGAHSIFKEALRRYFGGDPDSRTLELLGTSDS